MVSAGSPLEENNEAGDTGVNAGVTAATRAPERAAVFRVSFVYTMRPKSTRPNINTSKNGRIIAVSTSTCPFLFLMGLPFQSDLQ